MRDSFICKLTFGVLLASTVLGDTARILPVPIDPPAPPIEHPQPCGENEYFNSCGGCEATCDNPGPVICPLICRYPGQCRCSNGFVRSPDGDCVEAEECPNNTTDSTNTVTTAYSECGENEYLNDCGGCDGTCQEPNIACPAICGPPHCRCLQGYVRFGYAGKCIPQSQCPPRIDPCATVRCGFGKVCKVRAGRPVCVYAGTKPKPNPCAYTRCPVNTTCQVVTIYCFVAPCPPPRATCVPVTTTTALPLGG